MKPKTNRQDSRISTPHLKTMTLLNRKSFNPRPLHPEPQPKPHKRLGFFSASCTKTPLGTSKEYGEYFNQHSGSQNYSEPRMRSNGVPYN